MSAVDKLIATARAEIGYLEKATNSRLDEKLANPGKNNWTKYARDLDGIGYIYNGAKNGYDWCDVFVDWCFVKTFGSELAMQMLNQDYDGLGAGVKYSALYHKDAGQFYEKDPKPGDQIFFGDNSNWWHTGIVVEVTNGRVYTIEGNTSGHTNVVSNGGCVALKNYPINYIYTKGYGRPNYSLVEEEEEVTQEQFNEMMAVYLKQLSEQPDSNWGAEWEEAKAWAESNGLIKGDGSGNKQYQSYTTRQAMVLFLYRLTKMLKE